MNIVRVSFGTFSMCVRGDMSGLVGRSGPVARSGLVGRSGSSGCSLVWLPKAGNQRNHCSYFILLLKHRVSTINLKLAIFSL